jgi:hypothetical protein
VKRTSYQSGHVSRVGRKRGPDVWVFRYSDNGTLKAEQIGTIDQFKTKAAARKEADRKLLEINERILGIRVAGLCDRYLAEKLPKRGSTSATYRSFLRRIKDDWGKHRLDEMAADIMAVENWVNDLMTLGTPARVIPAHMVKGVLVPRRRSRVFRRGQLARRPRYTSKRSCIASLSAQSSGAISNCSATRLHWWRSRDERSVSAFRTC